MHQIAQICTYIFKNVLWVIPLDPHDSEGQVNFPSVRVHHPTFSELPRLLDPAEFGWMVFSSTYDLHSQLVAVNYNYKYSGVVFTFSHFNLICFMISLYVCICSLYVCI